jgi:hypothetical protein
MALDDQVSVPRALLRDVLDQAESDNFTVQSEFSCGEADNKSFEDQRAQISALRRLAGLTADVAAAND